MEKPITKRMKIRIFSFAAALFLSLTAAAVVGDVQSAKYKRQVLLTQQRALTELDTYIEGIETSLQKGIYANTPPMLDSLAMELSRQATGAKSSLAVLPLSGTNLENTYKFLSQIGDFVLSLNLKVAKGESISDKEREQLNGLLGYSKNLAKSVSQMRQDMLDENLTFEASESTLQQSETISENLADNMEDTEQTFTEYPSLIYDGPFSDHINQQKPKLLENAEEISVNTAQQKVADFLGVPLASVAACGEENDNTASFCFTVDTKTIAITKKGGYVLYMLNSATPGEEFLSFQDARSAAQAFLQAHGYEHMKESYYTTNDGVCIINFANVQNGIICYPDLVKVGVDLATGEIFSFDSRGYVMNHRTRDLGEPTIDLVTAKQSVSPILSIMDSRLTIIPTESKGEKLCYEFHCKDANGNEVLVYIDAITGYEDNILLLLYADDGVLTK